MWPPRGEPHSSRGQLRIDVCIKKARRLKYIFDYPINQVLLQHFKAAIVVMFNVAAHEFVNVACIHEDEVFSGVVILLP